MVESAFATANAITEQATAAAQKIIELRVELPVF